MEEAQEIQEIKERKEFQLSKGTNNHSTGIFQLTKYIYRHIILENLFDDKSFANLRETCMYMYKTLTGLLVDRDRLRVQAVKTNGKTSYAIIQGGGLFLTGNTLFGEGTKKEFTRVHEAEGKIEELKDKIEEFNWPIKKFELVPESAFALTLEGQLYSYGKNPFGQLGWGNPEGSHQFKSVTGIKKEIKDVWAARDKAFALTIDDQLVASGLNFHGALAMGDEDYKLIFTPALGLENVKVKSMTISTHETYIITVDGKILWCGLQAFCDQNSELPMGSRSSKFIEFSWDKDPIADLKFSPFDLNASRRFRESNCSAFILTTTGKLYSRGYNYFGQLGVGNKRSRLEFTPAVGLEGVKVKDFQLGKRMSFALTDDGKVYGCGESSFGCLAVGDEKPRYTFTPAVGLEGVKVKDLRVCDSVVCALTVDGQVFTAGLNVFVMDGRGNRGEYKFTRQLELTEKIDSLEISEKFDSTREDAKFSHIFALSRKNNLFAFGDGRKGQLGLGDNTFKLKFKPVILCDKNKPFSKLEKFWRNEAKVAESCAEKITKDAYINKSIKLLLDNYYNIKGQRDYLQIIIRSISDRIDNKLNMPDLMKDLLDKYELSWLFLRKDEKGDDVFDNGLAKCYLDIIDWNLNVSDLTDKKSSLRDYCHKILSQPESLVVTFMVKHEIKELLRNSQEEAPALHIDFNGKAEMFEEFESGPGFK